MSHVAGAHFHYSYFDFFAGAFPDQLEISLLILHSINCSIALGRGWGETTENSCNNCGVPVLWYSAVADALDVSSTKKKIGVPSFDRVSPLSPSLHSLPSASVAIYRSHDFLCLSLLGGRFSLSPYGVPIYFPI